METAKFIARKLVTFISREHAEFLPEMTADIFLSNDTWLPKSFQQYIKEDFLYDHSLSFYNCPSHFGGELRTYNLALSANLRNDTGGVACVKYTRCHKVDKDEFINYLALLFYHYPDVTLSDGSDITFTYKTLRDTDVPSALKILQIFPKWYDY